MEKTPMSSAPMSRYTMGAHLGLHLKNERKTKFRQLRVKWAPSLLQNYQIVNNGVQRTILRNIICRNRINEKSI